MFRVLEWSASLLSVGRGPLGNLDHGSPKRTFIRSRDSITSRRSQPLHSARNEFATETATDCCTEK
jgi:hypothetical protein